jgi:hypothetical protein
LGSHSGQRFLFRTIKRLNSRKNVVTENSSLYVHLDSMATQAGTAVKPASIANSTIRLKFYDLKMKVCKPFARTT